MPQDASDEESRCRLYLISPPGFVLEEFVPALEAALDGGDVAAFQLRLKDCEDDLVLAAAEALSPLCQARDVAFIVNDRPDLAAAAGADGVHVGAEDPSYEDARHTVGEGAIVGVTCRTSIPSAIDAAEAGADYVAFGAFFPSKTKSATAAADVDIIRWWDQMMLVPCVAIGGIAVDNCAPLVGAGADFLAVSAGVFRAPTGPREAVAAFNRVFDESAKQTSAR